MSGALVIGLCALSFAAGCVVTAVMLRRERTPEPEVRPEGPPPIPDVELRWPPEDYVTKPIHRNPVMGIPTALPPPEPSRPTLVVVPDPEPEDETEEPVRQDEVRRMRVVRDVPDDPDPDRREHEPEPTRQLSMAGYLSGPVEGPSAVPDVPPRAVERPSAVPDALPRPADAPDEPAGAVTGARPDSGEGGPVVIHVPAQTESAAEPRASLPVDTAGRQSGNA
ncbi:hypothetical protein [Saccharothrix hoggarensis]